MRNLAVNSAFASARQEQSQRSRLMKPSGVPWLGDIPAGWDVKRGKEILAPLKRPIREDDEIVTCFRDGEVTLRRNRREDGFTVAEKEIGYQGVEKGDLIVHGMDGFAGSIGVSDSRGKASPVLIVLNSTENKRFLMYYLRSLALCDVFLSLSTGIRERSCDLRWNKLGNIPYLLPPLPEQRAISDFLDEKCAAIDAIVEEAKAGIEEYAKWKQSVVFQAVTKGLDPHAKMKDSGVDIIGEMPEEWTCTHVGRIFTDILGKMLANESTNKEDTLESYVCAKDVHFSGIDTSDLKKMWFSPAEKTIYATRNTDLLVVEGGAGAGGAAVVNDGGGYFIQNSIHLVRSKHPSADTEYLRYWIFTAVSQGYIDFVCNKATIPHFTKEKLSSMPLPLPPLPEQRSIAAYLDEKCSAIDALIEEKKQLIEDLGVYKKSLIYETVTGKRRIEQ